jgi:NAD(P)-dependent dehydrogenase (short-subunit alcohol dehydrogenase family)
MSRRLDGKVALVTGAARGIGAAIAHRFAEEGASLLLTDADEAGARQVATDIGDTAAAHAHDVTSEPEWEAVSAWALEAHGHIDVLVNNAGVFLAAKLEETTLEDFRRVQEVNQVGVFLGMRSVAPGDGRARERLDHQPLLRRRADGLALFDGVRGKQVGGARNDQGGGKGARRFGSPRQLTPPRPDRHRHAHPPTRTHA